MTRFEVKKEEQKMKVMKREIVRQTLNDEYSYTDEFGIYHPCYDTEWSDFSAVDMTYEELCHDLGFLPEVNFVRVTKAGTIGFTCGKDNEIHALNRAITEKGYKHCANPKNYKGGIKK